MFKMCPRRGYLLEGAIFRTLRYKPKIGYKNGIIPWLDMINYSSACHKPCWNASRKIERPGILDIFPYFRLFGCQWIDAVSIHGEKIGGIKSVTVGHIVKIKIQPNPGRFAPKNFLNRRFQIRKLSAIKICFITISTAFMKICQNPQVLAHEGIQVNRNNISGHGLGLGSCSWTIICEPPCAEIPTGFAGAKTDTVTYYITLYQTTWGKHGVNTK